MGNLLLVGLVIAWVVVLGPTLFRRSDERRPSSLDAARDRLAAIYHSRRPLVGRDVRDSYGRTGFPIGAVAADPLRIGANQFVGSSLQRLSPSASLPKHQKRRRAQVLQILLGSCGLSFALAVGTSVGPLWLLQLGCDALLVGYVVVLRSVRNRSGRPNPRRFDHFESARNDSSSSLSGDPRSIQRSSGLGHYVARVRSVPSVRPGNPPNRLLHKCD